jgi:hypothetical protein
MNLRELERKLGLPLRYLDSKENVELPETQALLKMIDAMPWLIEVAESGFNPEVSQLILQREAINIKIEEARNGK